MSALKFASTLLVGIGLGLLVALKFKEESRILLRNCGVLLVFVGVTAAPVASYIVRGMKKTTEPNQAPEPTPTAVTPPAGQEARQP
jgi:hypothetical protein